MAMPSPEASSPMETASYDGGNGVPDVVVIRVVMR